jgi:hypothetical protein
VAYEPIGALIFTEIMLETTAVPLVNLGFVDSAARLLTAAEQRPLLTRARIPLNHEWAAWHQTMQRVEGAFGKERLSRCW